MRIKKRNWRRGTYPPKNESGRADTVLLSSERSSRSVSSGNGACIAAKTVSNSGPSTLKRLISTTRSLRSSTAMMSSTSSVGWSLSRMRRGKDGQTSSVSLAGVSDVQTSRKFRRRADPKTTRRQRRHRGLVSASPLSPFCLHPKLYPHRNRIFLVGLLNSPIRNIRFLSG